MNTVSTKPVRHRFGKVSTEEVRQDSSGRGPGLLKGSGHRPPVELCHVGSEESASLVRGDLSTPPEVGAGTPEVSMCVLKPRGREGKARSPLTHTWRMGSWSTRKDVTPHPPPPALAGGGKV